MVIVVIIAEEEPWTIDTCILYLIIDVVGLA